MFEKSHTFKRFGGGGGGRTLQVHLGHVPWIQEERPEEQRGWKIAFAATVALHLALFLVVVPEQPYDLRPPGPPQKVYVIQQVRFEPPRPQPQQQLPKPVERKRIVPIPDPTPDDPEPIRVAEIEVPEYDPLSTFEDFTGIPDAPPGEGIVGGPPLRLGGAIVPPVKVHYPQPRYTEEGRLSRVQGVVILEAIIDALGEVHNVKVLKGLPSGLSEAAVEAAREWKFRPATLDGEPVPVFLNLTIRFSLQ